MTKLLAIVLATAVLFGICVYAIEAGDDRKTLIPPPDAVAEAFTREVLTGRWARAKEYLQEPESRSDEELRALRESIERRVRVVSEVESETVAMDDDRALANVRVSSSFGSESIAYQLVFDDEWKIAF